MAYVHKEINGVDVIELDDALDLYSSPLIKKFVKTLLTGKSGKIVIVMEKVGFVDSSGLGMLVNLVYESKQKGVIIKLASISPATARIIQAAKKQNNFEIFATTIEAIQSF